MSLIIQVANGQSGSGGGSSITTPVSLPNGGWGQDMTITTLAGGSYSSYVAPTGVLRLTGTAIFYGIVNDGTARQITIYSQAGVGVTIGHESVFALAANRFHLPVGNAYFIAPESSASFFYDTVTQRWVLNSSSIVQDLSTTGRPTFLSINNPTDVAINIATLTLESSGGTLSLNWSDRAAYDSSNTGSLDWQNRRLSTSTGAGNMVVLDWELQRLYDFNNIETLDWSARTLQDSSPAVVMNWGVTQLLDTVGITSVDWNARLASDGSLASAINWSTRILYDSGGVTSSIDWNGRSLNNTAGLSQIDWSSSSGETVNFPNATTTTGGGLGTLTNVPTAGGDPAGYLTVIVNTNTQYIPYW